MTSLLCCAVVAPVVGSVGFSLGSFGGFRSVVCVYYTVHYVSKASLLLVLNLSLSFLSHGELLSND